MALASYFGAPKIWSCMQYVRPSTITIWIKQHDEKWASRALSSIICRSSSSKSQNADESTIGDGPALNPKKKKVFLPRVTLLSENNEMSVVTLEMAQKISARRNLKLIKIVDYDTKTERPTYKLMTSKEYLQTGLELKRQKKNEREQSVKSEKLFSISTKISDCDLQTKLRSIMKLLVKKHEIRVLISYDGNSPKADEICTQLETATKNLSPIIKKAGSATSLRVYLRPNLEVQQKADSSQDLEDSKNQDISTVP